MPRLRFSLKTLFLVLLFISLAASNLFTSYRLKQLHEENVALRKETGRLVVKDPAKLNLVAVPTFEDLTWRWRVHVPEGSREQIYIAGEQIPMNGYTASFSAMTLDPGDYLLTATVRRNHLGDWLLTVGHSGSSASTTISDQRARWLERQTAGASGWGMSQAGQNDVEVRQPGKKLELVRLRVMVRAPNGSPSTTGEPSEGHLLWIDDERL